jgi:hypothetical protein
MLGRFGGGGVRFRDGADCKICFGHFFWILVGGDRRSQVAVGTCDINWAPRALCPAAAFQRHRHCIARFQYPYCNAVISKRSPLCLIPYVCVPNLKPIYLFYVAAIHLVGANSRSLVERVLARHFHVAISSTKPLVSNLFLRLGWRGATYEVSIRAYDI